MRKLFLIMAIVSLSFCATAQSKKVAVMETKADEGVSSFQSNMVRGGMEQAVANAQGYEGYDRSAFDMIMKEQNFQRSGAVNDQQIRKLGQMAGVQYVLVSEASTDGSGFFILAKLLDVETGKYGNVVNDFCKADGQAIFNASNALGARLFGASYGGGSITTARNQSFTETAYGLNMRMVYVEGGTFTMGCTSEQSDCDDDETTRQTTVSSFYIGMLEVTQSQWEKVMGTTVYQQRDKANTAWSMQGTGPDYPMYYVSWEEAKEFCARLSRQTGKTYRLPTEAEWEYAARGGNKKEGTKYSGGWSIGEVAWYCNNSGDRNLSLNRSNWDKNIVLNNNCETHPCGTKKANALGIYDMSGNVYEWCEDWYGSYLSYDTNNPKGASSGQLRVLRGGSWNSYARRCLVSLRSLNTPSYRHNSYGFRVVLVP